MFPIVIVSLVGFRHGASVDAVHSAVADVLVAIGCPSWDADLVVL